MSTFVAVSTYTHSVTFVTESILRCLKDIVRDSGLDPGRLASQWTVLERGLSTWLGSQHLESVRLEVFDARTGAFVGGWEFAIAHSWRERGVSLWVDTEQIQYALRKQGLWPSSCDYRVVVTHKPGYVSVDGWQSTTLRSTDGFVRQSLGTAMDSSGLGAAASYFRKK